MDVAESKNSRGMDHGSLFQETDRKRSHSDQVDYDFYQDKDDPELAAMEIGFEKPLRDVVPRLELLGFTLESIRAEYDKIVEETIEQNHDLSDLGVPMPDTFMSFDQFMTFVTQHKISELDDEFIGGLEEADRAKKIEGRFYRTGVAEQLPQDSVYAPMSWSEKSYFRGLLDFLHPYSAVRLLGENKYNLDQLVLWQYGPLVNSGWAKETEFNPSAKRRESFLIATEGSSDVKILTRAFEVLRPEISDFFRFIDVDESHPFSGTGNLHKFAEGLAKIDIHNQTVFLYDNDAEGHLTYNRTTKLKLPNNMRVAILPDHESFKAFSTLGPSGLNIDDINRRAAAIECYLDLSQEGLPNPIVRWSSYNKDVDSYQGSLENKSQFSKKFFKLMSPKLKNSDYDTSKLEIVLDLLVQECCDLAGQNRKVQIQSW